jgi:PAS domain-containing protein
LTEAQDPTHNGSASPARAARVGLFPGFRGLGLSLALALPLAGLAQAVESSPGIYTCIDSKGRRITADRPIAECLDREQRELGQTGITKRIVPPSLTAEERAREEARQQAEAAQKTRQQELLRRDRALLARYPGRSAHDAERGKQLAQVDDVIKTIQLRREEITKQREALNLELEFYKADPGKAPAWLKHRLQDNSEQLDRQRQLLVNQDLEKQRIHQRFDEELQRLKPLWSSATAAR